MLTIGRSNYLRFNHPEEAKLMKSVLPSAHISMAPIQFQPNDECMVTQSEFTSHSLPNNQCYQTYHHKIYKDNNPLSTLDHELDLSLKEFNRKRPPAIPKKPYRDLDYSDSNSDAESQKPKISSIMAKVSKFEYYAKSQQKTIGRSQFYTSEPTNDISPKVFSSNSLTVNTPAKDVLGGKNAPTNYTVKENNHKAIINENNSDPRNCSYANVTIRKARIDDIVRNFDDNRNGDVKTLKKVNNDEQNKHEGVYGKINKDRHDNTEKKLNIDLDGLASDKTDNVYAKAGRRNLNLREFSTPSPSFNRNPEYVPVYNPPNHLDRSMEAETKRMQRVRVPMADCPLHQSTTPFTNPLSLRYEADTVPVTPLVVFIDGGDHPLCTSPL
ncbi:hypothetical protein EVAR_16421_1 [Eumeta japonica]|uniref:Uncharacterized protein n=1 Tax=Eumeta variegata TaxID=151549 RepID=A0A4C1UK69_EUMVA|nr:hypothetical protein EVAR_16421_1 [Eumeta japonica]